MNKKIAISILLLSIFLSLLGAQVYLLVHEEAHRNIFSSYSIPSTSQVNLWRLTGGTIVLDDEIYESNKTPELKLAQNINDVVGYHTAILIFNIWIMFFLYLFTILIMWIRTNKLKETKNE